MLSEKDLTPALGDLEYGNGLLDKSERSTCTRDVFSDGNWCGLDLHGGGEE